MSTIQTLTMDVLIATGTYVFILYPLKALRNQDFELLKQALPKSLTKSLRIIEQMIFRLNKHNNNKLLTKSKKHKQTLAF